MTSFKVNKEDATHEATDSEVIKMFLSSVDIDALSNQVLEEMGWGESDPIHAMMAKLFEEADKW